MDLCEFEHTSTSKSFPPLTHVETSLHSLLPHRKGPKALVIGLQNLTHLDCTLHHSPQRKRTIVSVSSSGLWESEWDKTNQAIVGRKSYKQASLCTRRGCSSKREDKAGDGHTWKHFPELYSFKRQITESNISLKQLRAAPLGSH